MRLLGQKVALLNSRTEILLSWGLRPNLRTASHVARIGPTHRSSEHAIGALVDVTDVRSIRPSEPIRTNQ